jgi:hypothetical protein
MCNLNVILLTEDYTETFYMFDKGDISSIQYKMSLKEFKCMSKVDRLSLILINFYVPALTPRLNSTKTTLQFSENTLCGLSHIYRRHQQKELDTYQVFGAYHLYIDCTMWETGENLVAPLLV